MDESTCTAANIQAPIHRSQTKIRFTVSEPILRLAKRLAEEKRQRRDHIHKDTPATLQEIPRPRSTYLHKRITAVLSFESHGFTLDNGVNVVAILGPYDIAEELVKMHVRILYCFDGCTYRKWRDLQKDCGPDYKKQLVKLRVLRLKPFSIKHCHYCDKKSCSIWKANAGISNVLKIPFNPIEHCKKPVTGRNVFRHNKVAAVLAIGGDGFTLTNGVDSVSYDRRLSNPDLHREVLNMKVRVLNCVDQRTYKIWSDVQKCYQNNFEKLKISLMEPIEMRKCETCKNDICHKWKASVGISERYKLKFDPIEH